MKIVPTKSITIRKNKKKIFLTSEETITIEELHSYRFYHAGELPGNSPTLLYAPPFLVRTFLEGLTVL